jgi:hypothetical protein
MSNNPAGASDLGSAYSTVGYRYDDRGMEQFLAHSRQAEQAITRLQQVIAQQQPLIIPIAGLERGITQQLTQLQNQLQQARPFQMFDCWRLEKGRDGRQWNTP